MNAGSLELEEYDESENSSEETPIEYDIVSTPNDFNVLTIFSFVQSKTLRIPDFQRGYVWDQKRASKLIESLLIGLPVPQVFLFEEKRGEFIVIDGQQRLLTIYFFLSGRFPRDDQRVKIRRIFDEKGFIPEEVIQNDLFFTDFRLKLPSEVPEKENPFNGFKYATLADWKTTLDLRVVRNVVVRQNAPDNGSRSKFEIFSRLNSGGMNLKPQEIRASLFHSEFYVLLRLLNLNEAWRKMLGSEEPDLHLRDVELILRGFAFAKQLEEYRPSMQRFLNAFSHTAQKFTKEDLSQIEHVFEIFIKKCEMLPKGSFAKGGKLSVALLEATLALTFKSGFEHFNMPDITPDRLEQLSSDEVFAKHSVEGAAKLSHVKKRFERARAILCDEA